jgi:predicted dehydrogenase
VQRLGAAVIGAGYWGPNLVRNLSAHDGVDLRWVCDLDADRAQRAIGRYGRVSTTCDLEVVLDDPTVDMVAIATPASTHVDIGLAALDAGKHVLIEKPLASSTEGGRKLVGAARDAGLVLMCDHTYCFTPAVQRIRSLIDSGELGEVLYVDSVRVNLGLVQSDIDVVWDLAPHDLSILDHVLPAGSRPTAVAATGADPVRAGQRCVAHMSLPLGNGGIAHSHVNWLSPTKIRRIVVGGSRRMLVWDDLQPAQRLQVFDAGVQIEGGEDEHHARMISYRTGDMMAPALPEREALSGVIDELVASIEGGRPPTTSGESGLRVLEVLEATTRSFAEGGALIALEHAW